MGTKEAGDPAVGLRGAGMWIWHDRPLRERSDMGLFCGILTPPAAAVTVDLHASADNRYRLYVDAGRGPERLGCGPARGNLEHTSLDPYTVRVHPGRSVRVWAAVRFLVGRPEQPIAEAHGHRPGFLLLAAFRDRAGRVVGAAGSGRAWRACATHAIRPLLEPSSIFWMGATEEHSAAEWPEDWLAPGGPRGRAWRPAVERSRPYPKGLPPYASDEHWLVPRELPRMEERPARFRRAAPAASASRAQLPRWPVRVRPGGTLSLLFDAGETVCAYPVLRVHGRGCTAALTYAEVLKRRTAAGAEKSFRLADGFAADGPRDRFETGAVDRAFCFETFHWRSFRFVRLDVTAGPGGAAVLDLSMVRTGYPWKRAQTFDVRGPAAAVARRIVDASWRTIRCCTWETYMDCPFYEQLQYIGDTRLQMLISYLASTDRRLPQQALLAFDRSRIHEGITQSRGPATEMQLIPTFSLIYVLMLDDYVRHTGDRAFVQPLLSGAAAILRWTRQRLDSRTGLLGPLPYWPFIDWVWDAWSDGVPPGRCNSLPNLFYLLALDAAARLFAGQPRAAEYRRDAKALRRRVYSVFWDRRLGLLRDRPAAEDPGAVEISQHAQALGVLGGVLRGAEARRALRQAIEGAPGLQFRQATLYFRFYLAEALAAVRWGEGLWGLLQPFREALARGSTTWPESYEPCRSECHAWGSWPMYFFGRHVLGVDPSVPPERQRLRPLHCPPLEDVSGVVVTAHGPVRARVAWRGGKARVTAAAVR